MCYRSTPSPHFDQLDLAVISSSDVAGGWSCSGFFLTRPDLDLSVETQPLAQPSLTRVRGAWGMGPLALTESLAWTRGAACCDQRAVTE